VTRLPVHHGVINNYMGLGDVYLNNVKKTSISMTGINNNIPLSRERDPRSVELENNVFTQLRQAAEPINDSIKKHITPINNTQIVGVEQAMKELLDSAKSLDNKS